MAKAPHCDESIYALADRWRVECLVSDGSLFEDPKTIWTAENVQLAAGSVGVEDLGPETFEEKLRKQLDGASAGVVQLVSELYCVVLMCELDTGPEKKRSNLAFVTHLYDPEYRPPDLVARALGGGGVARFGVAKSRRDYTLRWILDIAGELKSMPSAQRAELLSDPIATEELFSKWAKGQAITWAKALRHLLFPNDEPAIISTAEREKLPMLFPGFIDDPSAPEGRQLLSIEQHLLERGNGEPDIYEGGIGAAWRDKKKNAQWDALVAWGKRFFLSEHVFESETFDTAERDFKLRLGARLEEMFTSLGAGEAWLSELSAVFRSSDNNLISFYTYAKFLDWADANQAQAAAALTAIANEAPLVDRLTDFLAALPTDAVAGPGTRASVASFLLLGVDATKYPIYKPEAAGEFLFLTGKTSAQDAQLNSDVARPDDAARILGVSANTLRAFLREEFPRTEGDESTNWILSDEHREALEAQFGDASSSTADQVRRYTKWIDLLTEFRFRLLIAGVDLRDLLDAQGLAWCLAKFPPPSEWAAEEAQEFQIFRTGGTAASSSNDATQAEAPEAPVGPKPGRLIPDLDLAFAESLLMPLTELRDIADRLEETRQLIFYGPPGTGKTFVAKRFGELFEAIGGSFSIVQFHPSYTYEDFFEGFRPEQDENGGIRYVLTPGVLRRTVEKANAQPDKPHVLVIDEINRGNIAKIFGELYFLLEYRGPGQSVTLQYSNTEQFTMPENLFIIGTMNTADRSIALVDVALRRRFDFFEFTPLKAPVAGLLERWLGKHGLDLEPSQILDALNDELSDRDYAVGPALLMTRSGEAPDLEKVWKHRILPTLEEQFYGSVEDVDEVYALKRISTIARREPEVESDDELPPPPIA